MKTLHFTYESIGNFVKLLATIRFENTHSGRDVAIWHDRFDREDGDELFERFLMELYPEGKTIDVDDVDTVVSRAIRFLETDREAQDIRNNYIKFDSYYWVYFKPDNKVYPCEFAEHRDVVSQICSDFFKGFDDIDLDYLEKFIVDNFEIASDNSTVERIAKDAHFIRLDIVLRGI